SSSSIFLRKWVTGTPPVTHTYIQAIKQPTLHYLTRSVRRRAATSKRAYRKLRYSLWTTYFGKSRGLKNESSGSYTIKRKPLFSRLRCPPVGEAKWDPMISVGVSAYFSRSARRVSLASSLSVSPMASHSGFAIWQG